MPNVMRDPKGGTGPATSAKKADPEDDTLEEDDDTSDGNDADESADQDQGGGEGGSTYEAELSGEYGSVDKLPPELRGIGKKMLASHTRAMQAAKKEMQDAETALATKYASAVKNSNTLAEVLKLPGFAQFYEDVKNGRGYGASAKSNQGSSESDTEDEDKPLTKADIAKIVDNAVGTALRPFLDRESSQTVAAAEKRYGKLFNKYRPEVTDYIQKHPGAGIDEAMKIVAHDDLIQEAVEKALAEASQGAEELGKKRIKTEHPSASAGAGGGVKKSKKEYTNLDDALRDALTEIREAEK